MNINKYFKRFLKEEKGSILFLFAISIIPLLGFVGLSVDIGRAYQTQSTITGAVDAAAMAAARVPPAEAEAEATRVFNAYVNGSSAAGATITSFVYDEEGGRITIKADRSMDTTLLRVIGQNTMVVGATTSVSVQNSLIEVALVLDNTGSMDDYVSGHTKMYHLKNSAKAFLDIVFDGESEPDNLFISVVPYITQVNPGPYTSWLSAAGLATVNNNSLFPNTTNGRWRGCMLARLTGTLHRDATPPSDAATKFLPYRWPSTLIENYPYPSGSIKPWGNWFPGDNDWTAVNVTAVGNNNPLGPEAGCPTQTRPLTNKQSDLENTIDDMVPIGRGGTFCFEGLVWGWRSISALWNGYWHSPNPHNLPLPKGESTKYLILMTDGENMWGGNYGPWFWFGDRHYTAYGRRFGTSNSPLNNNLVNSARGNMDSLTQTICTSVKNDDIVVYTIAFGNIDTTARNMLRTCASDPDKFFNATSGGDITSAFQSIAKDIGKLRYRWYGH